MSEKVKIESYRELEQLDEGPYDAREFLSRVMDRFTAIIERRNRRSREIEIELVGKERTLYQIIQGSTIPTFVINQDHIITHWNRALEKLTGLSANQQIGTNRQWAPFYDSPRPSMADVILSQPDESEIRRLYGAQWRKSALIEEAYEAEGFFPQPGRRGQVVLVHRGPHQIPRRPHQRGDRDPLGQNRRQTRGGGARTPHGRVERHGLGLLGPERPGGSGGTHPHGHGRASKADRRRWDLHLSFGR